jgi:hypothetical protein
MIRELRLLEEHRMRHDLSWPKLSQDMARVGVRVSAHTLYHNIKVAPTGKPFDRTLYKVRKYLKAVQSEHRKRRVTATRRVRPVAVAAAEPV